MSDRQLIADLLSALEYHTEQTRPIEFSKVAIQAARDHLRKPAREWVGLTDEDTRKINQEVWGYVSADHTRMWEYARAIEAKLREKNT